MRIALVAPLVLVLAGCGALSANSAQSVHEVAANGLFYGAMALASAATAPSDATPPEFAPAHSYTARTIRRTRSYECVDGAGMARTIRALSHTLAQAACGPECACADPQMSEELRYFERPDADATAYELDAD